MTTITLTMVAHRRAARHGMKPPYLARLAGGPVGVERTFIGRLPSRKGANQITWSTTIAPGEVYEARTYLWNGDRERYEGGTSWLVHDGLGVRVMGRDEAFAFVASATRIEAVDRSVPTAPAAERAAPSGIWWQAVEEGSPPARLTAPVA